jgi:hypothetical protein
MSDVMMSDFFNYASAGGFSFSHFHIYHISHICCVI